MIKRLFTDWKRKYLKVIQYFKDSKEEVKNTNLKILWILSIILCIFIAAFSCLTALMLKGWGPSAYHYTLFFLMLLFAAISGCANKKKEKHRWMEKILCACFVGCLMVFLICIDTIPSPHKGQIFVSLFLVAAPILFIVPVWEMLVFQSGCLVTFVCMTYHFKELTIAQTDTLTIILSYFMSIVIYSIVLKARVAEYMEKSVYKISSEKDPLTGIDNRTTCNKRIDQLILKFSREKSFAMMVLDVDNFKNINDTLGHSRGDEVLIAVADILTETFRKSDVIGRFGGDEFIVFLADFEDIDFIKYKCNCIEEKMKYVLGGFFNITCSIGVCVVEEEHVSKEKMFQIADEALYGTKTFHKGKYTIHEYSNTRLKEEEPLMVIVDDLQIDREVMALQFEDDFQIEKFESGKEGLKYIEEHASEISVVLLDLIIPDLGGIEILKKLRGSKDTNKIPVVVISSDEMSEEEVLLYGADDMLVKPIVPAIARLRVQNAMRRFRK